MIFGQIRFTLLGVHTDVCINNGKLLDQRFSYNLGQQFRFACRAFYLFFNSPIEFKKKIIPRDQIMAKGQDFVLCIHFSWPYFHLQFSRNLLGNSKNEMFKAQFVLVGFQSIRVAWNFLKLLLVFQKCKSKVKKKTRYCKFYNSSLVPIGE